MRVPCRREWMCRASPFVAAIGLIRGMFSSGSGVSASRPTGLCWADRPQDAVFDPACPRNGVADLLPRHPSGGSSRNNKLGSCRPPLALRPEVRVGRPGAPDRHKAAMVAGLEHAQGVSSCPRSARSPAATMVPTPAPSRPSRSTPRRASCDPASTNDKAPDLRVVVSGVEIGAAWRRISKENRTYHSVKLDDPSFTAPIYANLFESN